MSGTNPISSYLALNNTTQTATPYKTGIDGNSVAGQRIVANFLPYGSTGMFVNVSAGHVYSGNTLTEVAAQQSSTIAAAVVKPRIDRICITKSSGGIVWVGGSESSAPSPPTIPSSCVPVAQVSVSTAATALGNSTVTDERDLTQVGQSAQQVLNYAADTGSANVYAVAPTPAPTAYAAGQTVILKPANNNTGACTLNVSSIGAINIKTTFGTDPIANMLSTTGTYVLIHDGTNFILQNPTISIAANSVLANASSASGASSALALSANTLLGMGSSNIIPIAMGANLSISTSSAPTLNVSASGAAFVSRVINSTAVTSYTPSSNVAQFVVMVQGQNGSCRTATTGSGGVGGAGYSEKLYSSPSSLGYTISIPTPPTSTAVAIGGTISFDVVSVTGSGGAGSSNVGSSGGVGSGGDFNATGGTGGTGSPGNSTAGGGGGAASRAGNGGNGGNASVNFNGGGGGTGGNNASLQTAGIAATKASSLALTLPLATLFENFSAGQNGSSIASVGNAGNGATGAETTDLQGIAVGSRGGGGVGGTFSGTPIAGVQGAITILEVLK